MSEKHHCPTTTHWWKKHWYVDFRQILRLKDKSHTYYSGYFPPKKAPGLLSVTVSRHLMVDTTSIWSDLIKSLDSIIQWRIQCLASSYRTNIRARRKTHYEQNKKEKESMEVHKGISFVTMGISGRERKGFYSEKWLMLFINLLVSNVKF